MDGEFLQLNASPTPEILSASQHFAQFMVSKNAAVHK